MRLQALLALFCLAAGDVFAGPHEKRKLEEWSSSSSSSSTADEIRPRETFRDVETGYTAYIDPGRKICYLEKLRNDSSQRVGRLWRQNRVLEASASDITEIEARRFAGTRIAAFCKDSTITPLRERDAVSRTKRQSASFRSPRFRGQTQSQYLNIGSDAGQKEGKAEAEATDYSSRALVSGSNGMGQAQSMSSGGGGSGCEACPAHPEYHRGGSERAPVKFIHPGSRAMSDGRGSYRGESARPGTSIYTGGGGGGVRFPDGDNQRKSWAYPANGQPPAAAAAVQRAMPAVATGDGTRPSGAGSIYHEAGGGAAGAGYPAGGPTYPGGGAGSTYPAYPIAGGTQPGGRESIYSGDVTTTYPDGRATATGGSITYPGGFPMQPYPPAGAATGTIGGGTGYPGGGLVQPGAVTAYPTGAVTSGPAYSPNNVQTGGAASIPYPGGAAPVSYPAGAIETSRGPGYPGGGGGGGGGPTTYPAGGSGPMYSENVQTGGAASIVYPGGAASQPGLATNYPAGAIETSRGPGYPGGGGGGPSTYPAGESGPMYSENVQTGGAASIAYPGGAAAPQPGLATMSYPAGAIETSRGPGYPGGATTYPAGGSGPMYSENVQTAGATSGTYPGGGALQPAGGATIYPAGGSQRGVRYPAGGVQPNQAETSYAGGMRRPSGGQTGGAEGDGGYFGGERQSYPSGAYSADRYLGGRGRGNNGRSEESPRYYARPSPSGMSDLFEEEEENGDSHASSSVKENEEGTVASASSDGTFGTGTAESRVSGTYTGGGSFSAQAGTSDGKKGARTRVSGGKEGATSSAQGNGGEGKSETRVELETETGTTTTGAQSGGRNHGTNSQVRASAKGGMADARANGQGSTSSQAQIGFQPYDGSEEKNIDSAMGRPFRGGGTAAAQSGTFKGQSQSQLHGSFQYGITYNGAAQAGSGSGAAAAAAGAPFNFSTTDDTELFKPFDPVEPLVVSSTPSSSEEKKVARGLQGSSSSRKSVVTSKHDPPISTIATNTKRPHRQETYYDDYEDEEYDEDEYETNSTRRRVETSVGAGDDEGDDEGDDNGQRSRNIGTREGRGREDDRLLEAGTSLAGYTIPPGIRARITSVSTGAIANSKTQTPGGDDKDTALGARYPLPTSAPVKQNYYTVTNSVAGKIDDPRRKYEHRYYTKSSTCGYFTFSCNIVHGSNGRTKICKPRVPTHPDGTPIKC